MPISTYRSVLGIAKETTQGVPVAPVDFIPVTGDPKPKISQTLLDDKGWRGSATELYGKVAGQRSAEINIDANVEPSTFGYVLQSMLPDLTVTGASTPYTTAMSLLNSGTQQPAGYTITDFDGSVNYQYSAARFSDVSMAFTADGLLTYTSKATTWAPVTYATALVPSFSAIAPTASWVGVIQIAGVSSLLVMDGSVDLKRSVTAMQTVDGNQDPYKMWSGPLAVSGKLTCVYEDQAELNRYLLNTQPALDISFSQGANSSVKLHMSKVAYTMATVERGKEYGTVAITFEAIANVTDVGTSAGYSPIKATLVSAKPTGTYA